MTAEIDKEAEWPPTDLMSVEYKRRLRIYETRPDHRCLRFNSKSTFSTPQVQDYVRRSAIE
jgi:hypothetical protein